MNKEQKLKLRTILGVRVNCFVRYISLICVLMFFTGNTFASKRIIDSMAEINNPISLENVSVGYFSNSEDGRIFIGHILRSH